MSGTPIKTFSGTAIADAANSSLHLPFNMSFSFQRYFFSDENPASSTHDIMTGLPEVSEFKVLCALTVLLVSNATEGRLLLGNRKRASLL